jgi:hypothetical protein
LPNLVTLQASDAVSKGGVTLRVLPEKSYSPLFYPLGKKLPRNSKPIIFFLSFKQSLSSPTPLALTVTQGCQIFLGTIYQNGEKYTRFTTKYTKLPQTILNGRKIDQMSIKYTNIFHCKDPTKFTQIALFCLKIYHLATLLSQFGFFKGSSFLTHFLRPICHLSSESTFFRI